MRRLQKRRPAKLRLAAGIEGGGRSVVGQCVAQNLREHPPGEGIDAGRDAVDARSVRGAKRRARCGLGKKRQVGLHTKLHRWRRITVHLPTGALQTSCFGRSHGYPSRLTAPRSSTCRKRQHEKKYEGPLAAANQHEKKVLTTPCVGSGRCLTLEIRRSVARHAAAASEKRPLREAFFAGVVLPGC